MLKSNKILLCTAIGIFVAIPIIVGLSSISAQRGIVKSKSTLVTQTTALKNFQHLTILGTWDTKIVSGDQYQVTVTAPESMPAQYSVVQTGDTVIISNSTAINQNHFIVSITLPQLSSLELHGTGTTKISGFHGDDFFIKADGTQSLIGINNQFARLKLYASGTTSINLQDSKTTNASLEIFGTNNTKLNMQGGDLTGQAHGTVSIAYSGTAKTDTIAHGQAVKVEHLSP